MIVPALIVSCLLCGQVRGVEAGSAQAAELLARQRAEQAKYEAELRLAKPLSPRVGAKSSPQTAKKMHLARVEELRSLASQIRASGAESTIVKTQRLKTSAAQLAEPHWARIDYHNPQVGQAGVVRYNGDRIAIGKVIQIFESIPLIQFPNKRVVYVECDAKSLSDGDMVRFDGPVEIVGVKSYRNLLNLQRTVQHWRVSPLPRLPRIALTADLAPEHELLRTFAGRAAAFQRRSGASAVLVGADSSSFSVPLRSLNEADRAWVHRQERKQRADRWIAHKLVVPSKGFRTINAKLTGSYKLQFRANRRKTNYSFGVVAPIGDRHVQVLLSLNRNKLHGLSLIDGKQADKNESVIRATPLKNNVPHTIQVWVTHQEIEKLAIVSVFLNKQRIIHWAGPLRSLSTTSTYSTEPGRFAFYAACPVDFDQIALKQF